MRRADLTGERFGSVVVVRRNGHVKDGHTAWLCKCDCGGEVTLGTGHLKNRHVGCKECLSNRLSARGLKHGYAAGRRRGQTPPRLYRIWVSMRQRCYNPVNTKAHIYLAKGIKVCDQWKSFDNFHDWALQNGYADGLTIDRVDSDKNYCPENCEWVTKSENGKRAHVSIKLRKAEAYQQRVADHALGALSMGC